MEPANPDSPNRRFITPLVIILLILIVVFALLYLLLQRSTPTPTPTATVSSLCTAKPQGGEGGSAIYPVDPKWKQLTILGQLFTAANCGSARLSKVPGVQGTMYQNGVALWTKTTPSPQLVTTLKSLNFVCGTAIPVTNCQQWNLDTPILISDLQKLEPYTDEFKYDQCIRCQQ